MLSAPLFATGMMWRRSASDHALSRTMVKGVCIKKRHLKPGVSRFFVWTLLRPRSRATGALTSRGLTVVQKFPEGAHHGRRLPQL